MVVQLVKTYKICLSVNWKIWHSWNKIWNFIWCLWDICWAWGQKCTLSQEVKCNSDCEFFSDQTQLRWGLKIDNYLPGMWIKFYSNQPDFIQLFNSQITFRTNQKRNWKETRRRKDQNGKYPEWKSTFDTLQFRRE